ncbi:MAG: ABC transporter permease [Blastocatellia bacterium]
MQTLLQDLRYGARMLLKHRGFTLIAVVTLALGIGANTAIFSVVNAVLLRPLPYREPGRLVMLWTEDAKRDLHEEQTSERLFQEWRGQSQSFSEMAIFAGRAQVLTGDSPERVKMVYASANLFLLLGVAPALGRTFSPEENDRRERLIVLSHGFWQRRFGGDPNAIGQTLRFDATDSAQIIGVMPAGFYFPDKETQFWAAERMTKKVNSWNVVGRLKPDVTMRRAQAEMTTISQRLVLIPPADEPEAAGFGVNVVPLLDQVAGKKLRLSLWVLLGAVGLVLLIACANVANLLLARGAAREREFAIRAALGARRARLLRLLLIESLLLALGAGTLGVALAVWGTRILAAFTLLSIPRIDEIRVDMVVLSFAAGLSLFAGLIFGLAPAWKMSRSDPNESLKEGGSASSGLKLRRTRGLLVIAECALAVVLLAGAGLLIRSFLRLQAVALGFNTDRVLLVRVGLPPRGNPIDPKTGQPVRNSPTVEVAKFMWGDDLFQRMQERIAGLPGVRSVGVVNDLLIKGAADATITVPGGKSGSPVTSQLGEGSANPDFFKTMGVPLLRGRYFSRDDASKIMRLLWRETSAEIPAAERIAPAIVNETFARRFFPAEDPIGKRFCEGCPGKPFWSEIVGVVGDMRRQGLERQMVPEYFSPYIARGGSTADIVVRTSSDPLALATAVREAIRSIEKNALILEVTTADQRLGELGAQRRFQTWLLAAFATLALTLSALGIYGLMHYAVAQRTHEIGIRIALGARTSDVLRLVIGQGMKLVLIGVGVGWLAALWVTDVIAHLLFEVSATDPATFVSVALLLLGVALLACYLPARRKWTRRSPCRRSKRWSAS